MSINKNTVMLSYNIIKGAECSLLLQMRVFLTEQNNVMVSTEELIVTTEYLLLQTRSRLNQYDGWFDCAYFSPYHMYCIP